MLKQQKFKTFIMTIRYLQMITLCVLILASYHVMAQVGHTKMPLKVLFVGYDPSKAMPASSTFSYPGAMSQEAFVADYPVRMPAFKALLNQYFTVVKTIDCRDYRPADSDPFDVTIFDFNPKPLQSQPGTEKNAAEFKDLRYLPDNFTKPVVFIASTAPEMGRHLGLKTDWLCLCLDADAHHLNTEHAIFKGPVNRVIPTMVMKKTPDEIYHYPSGDTVPKQLPMWPIQTVGFLKGTECRIGLVSRGSRFAEGPDAEVISSGVCGKDVAAVALARHGNFFLWGFGASPAQMTDEAKKVFVNVVAYMKQFDGKRPITHKYNPEMTTTDDVLELAASTTKEQYEKEKETILAFNESSAKERKAILEKKAAGKSLTSEELQTLSFDTQPEEVPTWESYLKNLMGKKADKFGTDATAFQKYVKDNIGYIYCNPSSGEYSDWYVDTDVQKIGVPNHSVNMLDSCIAMLGRDQPDLALRVLKRYTGENFPTAQQWNEWLSRNRDKLYFSETDGYKFKVNTYN
jgi:hypothetical protein